MVCHNLVMPDRLSREDENQTASRILRAATAEDPEETTETILEELERRFAPQELRRLAAKILGKKGGKNGGRARAEKLSPERRSEIARKAAKARWDLE